MTSDRNLYFLHEGPAGQAFERPDIVAAAAARRGIGFVALDSLTCDYSALPSLKAGDMLFNAGRGSVRLETLLFREGIGTFRTCGTTVFTNGGDTTAYCAMLEREGFPVPRTIHRLPPDNDKLDGYVEKLGGFPVVVKATNGSLGVGVMIAETMRSLRSLLDFLRVTEREFVLRRYIEPEHVARLCVLGGAVVASLKYTIRSDDFRGLPYRLGGRVMNFGAEVEALASRAAEAVRHDFVGIDLLIDKAGKPWILEVNAPSNFVAYEHDVGIPIGDLIVCHLLERATLAGKTLRL